MLEPFIGSSLGGGLAAVGAERELGDRPRGGQRDEQQPRAVSSPAQAPRAAGGAVNAVTTRAARAARAARCRSAAG